MVQLFFYWLESVFVCRRRERNLSSKNKQLQPVLQGDSFKEVFCKIQQELKVKVPDLALPFKGGAVGFISYDAVSQIEK